LTDRRPTRWQVVTAFAAVYLIWGSTYLAIAFAVDTLPPFTMAAVRFLTAGALLYIWARRAGAPPPTRGQWRSAAVVGALLLLGGNGGVVTAAQWVPSGLVALLVATAPLWMVLVHWLWGGGSAPKPALVFGLLLGLSGVVLLVGSHEIGGGGAKELLGGLGVIAGSLCWAVGSVAQRRLDLPRDQRMSPAVQMIAGGTCLAVASLLIGEFRRLDLGAVSLLSALSLLYLVLFGSIVAFSAYVWLLRVSTPARVGTYAYVNPVVALLLGWAFAGEALTGRALAAAAVILTAVMIIGLLGGTSGEDASETP
jgi:drug/metabolite transporter (DMT)-like permease